MIKEMEFGWPGGDKVGAIHFTHDVSPLLQESILKTLSNYFDITKAVLYLLHPSSTAAGSYRLELRENSFFIRITSRLGDFKLEKKFIDHLNSKNISVNNIIEGGIPFHWNNEKYRIDIRTFIPGNHFRGSLSELESLARELKKFHKAIISFEYKSKIKKNQQSRSHRHKQLIEQINDALISKKYNFFYEKESWVRAHEGWLFELINYYDPFLAEMDDAQCVHGQIHPGNVIFLDGRPILFDLETSIITFAPPSWDFSYFVQRFCMNDNPDEDSLSTRLAAIVAGYGMKLPSLTKMIRFTSMYSVMCAFDYRINENIVVPESEFTKFFLYDQQAKDMQNILK